MQPARILLLAGVVTAGAIGLAGLAHAGDDAFKTLTLQLPGGEVEQISYSGPVPPQIMLVPGAPAAQPAAAAGPFTTPDPFAQLARISALMDQQAASMMQAMQVMTPLPMPGPAMLIPAGLGSVPAGHAGFCMQSVEITSNGQGAPQITRRSAGDCGPANAAEMVLPARPASAVPAVDRAERPAAPSAPKLIRVRDTQPVEVPHASQS